MYKKLFLSLIFVALQLESSYTMYASGVMIKGSKVYANNSVVIYGENSIYQAKRAVYDRDSEVLELIGDVNLIHDGKTTTNSQYAKIELKDKKAEIKKFFIYDGESKLWIRGEKFTSSKKIYQVDDSEVSSCSIDNPDWKILFAKGKYNKEKEFLTLSRPTFYFKDLPIMALPWFAFPTVRKRTSGLLRPDIGVQSESGLIYIQPYFYAPSKLWDIEFKPQIRTDRGYGLYTTFNFVDSKYSSGSVKVGSFKEDGVYAKKNSIKNSSHYGVDIKYQSSSLLLESYKKSTTSDGFLLDIKYLNDIDYENLKSSKIESYNKLVTSRLNYHIKRDRDYIGIYGKYFIDTSKDTNSDTMQELPTLHYHRFTTNLPIKNLIYAVDYKYKNNYREVGLNAAQHELNMPLKFDIPLFDNFLNFSVSENLYYSKINYSKRAGSSIDDASYFSNYHKISLTSDLTKPYKNYLHNLQLESTLIVPSFEDKEGYFADFIHTSIEKKSLKLGVNQYFYDYDGHNFLSLRSSQNIYLKKEDKKYSDFLNEIVYKYSKNLTISENISYSHQENEINKIQTSINYNDEMYALNLYHTYKNDEYSSKINYLTTNFSANIGDGYKVDGALNYDIDKSLTRNWSLGLFRDKKCWDYKITYKESLIPIYTTSGSKSYKNQGLYFLVNFANIGGVAYDYSRDSISESGDIIGTGDISE